MQCCAPGALAVPLWNHVSSCAQPYAKGVIFVSLVNLVLLRKPKRAIGGEGKWEELQISYLWGMALCDWFWWMTSSGRWAILMKIALLGEDGIVLDGDRAWMDKLCRDCMDLVVPWRKSLDSPGKLRFKQIFWFKGRFTTDKMCCVQVQRNNPVGLLCVLGLTWKEHGKPVILKVGDWRNRWAG